jgi:hypothetical protein
VNQGPKGDKQQIRYIYIIYERYLVYAVNVYTHKQQSIMLIVDTMILANSQLCVTNIPPLSTKVLSQTRKSVVLCPMIHAEFLILKFQTIKVILLNRYRKLNCYSTRSIRYKNYLLIN